MYAYAPHETCVQQLFSETDKFQQKDDASTAPIFCLRYSNVSLGSGLVSYQQPFPWREHTPI